MLKMFKCLPECESTAYIAIHDCFYWNIFLTHVAFILRFQPVLDRVASQVWDSGADIHEIPVGFPSAVFPRNKFLQELFRSYIK